VHGTPALSVKFSAASERALDVDEKENWPEHMALTS
jgi:hypothetical protein